ncbi:MAG: tandem-95 repeat protein [Proteobacteria bacterium]|nr:tandem-95 repeat protein [Pseudomonadota bacterium]
MSPRFYIAKSLRTRVFSLSFFRFLSFVILLSGILVFPQNACAVEVTLAWDANGEEDLEGYRIFYREDGQNHDYDNPAWQGTATTCTISGLDDNTTYHFVARAYDTSDNESTDSDEATYQSYTLLLSTSSDRSNSVSLQSETVTGNIFVFTGPDEGVEQVSFYLDDPDMNGAPRQVEEVIHYDFAGTAGDDSANPFDTTQISNGQHEITAFIELTAGGSRTVSATFTVANSTNTPPTADNQSVSTHEDISVSMTLTATDVDGDSLTYTLVDQTSHGTLSGTAPNLTYSPDVNYNGSDSFSFKANDGQSDSELGTVSITLTAVNDAPVANDQSVYTDEDTAISGTLDASDVDGDALTYVLVTSGSKGTASVTNSSTGAFIYTPNQNANGTDTFTFKANDGTTDSNTATVTVTITPVNDAPVLDSIGAKSVDEDSLLTFTVTATDADGDTLTYSAGNLPTGSSFDADTQSFAWTPGYGSAGNYTVTFTVTDSGTPAQSDSEQVTITVGDVNRPPTADAGDEQSVDEGDTVTLDGSGSFDPDGTISYSWSQQAGPTTTLSDASAVRPSFTAPDVEEDGATLSFQLTVTDNGGLESTATCIVYVSWVDDSPALTSLSISGSSSVAENSTSNYTATATFSDGSTQTVTASADWSEESSYAGISGSGVLSASEVTGDETVTITASYTSSGVTKTDQKLVTITDVPESNLPSSTPVIASPYDGQMECDLMPSITTEAFSDPDGDPQSQSQWQISKQEDISSLILDITTTDQLVELPVPHTMLEADTTYYVRVRFYDVHGEASDWSDTVEFTTTIDDNDVDGNGVPDDQEVGDDVDLNEDGVADNDQPGVIKCAQYVSNNVTVGVGKASNSVTAIESVETIEPSSVFDNPLVEFTTGRNIIKQKSLIFGLFSYRIRVNEPGASATVKIYFSKKISPGSIFCKYDTVSGWQDYSEHTIFEKNRRSITLEVKDGGYGDSDGVANGIILDPGGIAETSSGEDGSALSGDTSIGCFINTAGFDSDSCEESSKIVGSCEPVMRLIVVPLVGIRYVLVNAFGTTGTVAGLLLAALFLAGLLRNHGRLLSGSQES